MSAFHSVVQQDDEDGEVLSSIQASTRVGSLRRHGGLVGAVLLLAGCACLLQFGRGQFVDLSAVVDLSADGPSPNHLPSLYCVTAMRCDSFEQDILEKQLVSHSLKGIFACDFFDVFSSKEVQLGETTFWGGMELAEAVPVLSVKCSQAPVTVSVDGTAGNAKLFANMWSTVKQRGSYERTDWTVKVDPDTVFFADRLQQRLGRYNPSVASYVSNCLTYGGNYYYDEFGYSYNMPSATHPNLSVVHRRLRTANHRRNHSHNHSTTQKLRIPSMYGALEVFSRSAMYKYFDESVSCKLETGFGEDRFMGTCLEDIGVHRIEDFDMVSDMYCKACNCSQYSVAYHPYKTTKDWLTCWNTAAGM